MNDPAVQIRLFGRFEIAAGNSSRHQYIKPSRASALLAYVLLATPETPLQRQNLAHLLWPEADEHAGRNNLRVTAYRLRRSLDKISEHLGDRLLGSSGTAHFQTTNDHVNIDVKQFEQMLDAVAHHAHADLLECPPCQARLRRALDLYDGEFLEGVSVGLSHELDDWITVQREWFHRLAVRAHLQLADVRLRKGDYAAVVELTRRLLTLENWNEHAYRQQMEALARLGRRSEALRLYQQCCQLLQSELGIEPERATTVLYRQIQDAPGQLPGVRVNPYRGLAAFESSDAHLYFGREPYVEWLVQHVEQPSLTAVLGPSGSGKSSLLRAGLQPRLQSSSEQLWVVSIMRPGEQPLSELGAAVRRLAQQIGVPDVEIESFTRRHDQTTLARVARTILNAAPPDSRLLLLIDQFEELYALSDAQIADELIALLREAVRQGVVTAVIALSSEYMSRLLDNRELADALRNNTLLLGPMSKAEMRRAIIEPARRQQVRFEPTLVDQLVDAVGRDRGRLPLLQFALDRLWKTAMTSASGGDVAEMTITVEMYQQIGQLEGALARHADSVLAALGREMAGVVRRVLMQMVEPVGSAGETRRTVRRRSLSDQQWEVVRRLADARLVVTRRSAGGDVVAELIHEALIRYWGRLEQWLIEDRAFRLWLARMRGALNQWEVSQRDDGALLRGAPLVEAELWLDTRRDDIPAHLFDFVTAALQRRAVEEIQQEQSHLRERAYLLTLRAELALAVGQTDEAVAAAWAASVFAEPDPLADMVLSRAAYAPGTVRVYRAHKSRVLGLTLDERRNIVVSAAADCTVAVWQLHHGTLLGQHQLHNAPVCCVSLAPNGEIALSGDTSGRLCLWQVDTGRILQQWDGHTGAISDVAWLPDGQRAISASADTIYIWDVLNGVRVGKLLGHSGSLNCLALSGDGKLLLSGGEDHHVRLWDVAARRPVQLLAGHTNMLPLQPQTHGHFSPVMGVCFLQNGKQALSVGIDRQLCVWDLERGVADAIFQLDVNLVSVGVLPGGCHCAVGSTDNQILLVELATGEIIARLNGHTGRAERVLALQDGRHILSAATDGSVRLWDSMHGALLHRYHDVVHKLPVVAVDVTADGRVGVFCYADGTLARWNGEQDVIEQRWQGHDDLTMACRISPDGRLLATGSGDVFAKPLDSSVRVWELATGRQLHRFEGHTRHVWEVAWLPDMQAVVSGSEDGTVRLWSLADGSQRVLHDVSPQLVKGIDVSPDGRSLLIGQAQGRSYDPCFDLLLVDIATGETVRRLVGHQETVYAVRFSADGRCALSGGNDKVVRLWDVATGDCLQALQGHHHQIVALAYHPNGRLAASGSHDCSVIVWDLERGIALRRFDGHTNAVWGVQFIDEGRQLLSADEDGVFCRWRLDADTAALQSWIRQNRWLPTTDQ